jgi:hypothetical protein
MCGRDNWPPPKKPKCQKLRRDPSGSNVASGSNVKSCDPSGSFLLGLTPVPRNGFEKRRHKRNKENEAVFC